MLRGFCPDCGKFTYDECCGKALERIVFEGCETRKGKTILACKTDDGYNTYVIDGPPPYKPRGDAELIDALMRRVMSIEAGEDWCETVRLDPWWN